MKRYKVEVELYFDSPPDPVVLEDFIDAALEADYEGYSHLWVRDAP